MSTAPQSTQYQALYRACMKEAADRGRTLMERLVVHCRQAMPQRADMSNSVERKLQLDALQLLLRHEAALCQGYPQALLAEFAQAIAGSEGRAGALSFDSLELMGEDQMQENVELVRAQQATALQCDAELAELNALICAVQGLKSVQAERNPLRPEVYVRGLRAAIMQTGAPSAVRLRWMQHMGEALGPELARAYGELSQMLRGQGVTAAGFTVVQQPDARAPAGRTEPPAPANPEKREQSLLNLRQLQRLLAGEFDAGGGGGDAGAGAGANAGANAGAAAEPFAERFRREFEGGEPGPGQADFSPTLPAALETLQEMKQVDKVMQRLAQRQGGRPDPAGTGAAVRERLRSQARSTGQALGLEVVNLMVENIASDPRLLPLVQQTVRDLEPALMRLTLSDPRFFSDRQHPARQLLEQMTQRSLAWQSVDSPGFAAFLEPLQQAVEALLATHIEGAEPFAYALSSLNEAWGDQQKRDRWHREKAVRALLQAEQRNLLADKLAKELRGRADMATACREIAHFLTGPWAQVMAQARLSDTSGAADPGGYAGIISDLLWSTRPELAEGGGVPLARLSRLVPQLLDKLRRGLASIDYPSLQTQRFIDHLGTLHQQAMKPAAGEAARPRALSTSMTRAELEARFAEDDDAGPWLAPAEARNSGFMDTQNSLAAKPLFQATQPGFDRTLPPDTQPPEATGLAAAGLQVGAWVDLLVDGQWVRNQLTWASPHATLYMFTSGAGTTHSMTRRLLDKMLAMGSLRVVSGQALVDGALDAVAQAALRNSMDVKPS